MSDQPRNITDEPTLIYMIRSGFKAARMAFARHKELNQRKKIPQDLEVLQTQATWHEDEIVSQVSKLIANQKELRPS